jgi:hypothetical protein
VQPAIQSADFFAINQSFESGARDNDSARASIADEFFRFDACGADCQ